MGTAIELPVVAGDSVVTEQSVLLECIMDAPMPSNFDYMATVRTVVVAQNAVPAAMV